MFGFGTCSLPYRQLRNVAASKETSALLVHCHIGSLERLKAYRLMQINVHCHIGSLEIDDEQFDELIIVHCHIGSLEM